MKIFLSYGHDSNAPLIEVQYETAIQQLADNISSIKKSYKSFFVLFRINKDKLNKEFEEFANYFK